MLIPSVLPCLWWLALCKKFHENPSIFTETGYICTPFTICSLQEMQKSGLSNNSLPACFEIGLFRIIFLRLTLTAIVSVVSHSSVVWKTKTENFIVLCMCKPHKLYTHNLLYQHHSIVLQSYYNVTSYKTSQQSTDLNGQGYMPKVSLSAMHGI